MNKQFGNNLATLGRNLTLENGNSLTFFPNTDNLMLKKI
jgi:hypothetical protein